MNPYDILLSPADRAACGEAVPTAATPRTEKMAPGGSGCAMPSLAMVYAKLHPFSGMYSPEEALSRGTLFQALDMPLMVGGRK